MNEQTKAEQNPPRRGRHGPERRRYTYDEKLRAVKLHLEEGFTERLVSEETGVCVSTLSSWVIRYRKEGELGLRGQAAPRPGRRLPAPVTEKILELKRANRLFGVQRIADALRRWFFLQASPETVRKTLHAADLMEERPKPRRNLTRPRFFERATPNQMWQSDIFTFRLGGKYAYVVAFLDDYSRYVVNLDLYRSPTGAAVIETYRVAAGEYQPPKEMLTDRGPQYLNWRGKSRFAVELTKDRVAHLVSRPQHPMTLGKVERFWATMWQEFLVRAQFDSFESARERLKLWVRYYNHRRPHQGIGGLCPADRFFEVAGEMKKTIQAGIQDNLLEMALRGKPKAPFYLVGRMEGQSVVLKAEKGQLKLSVNEKEMTYELEKGNSGETGKDETQTAARVAAHGGAESAGGAGDLDGAGEDSGSDALAGGELCDPAAVAGTGDGGDAAGLGAEGEPDGRGRPEPTDPGAPGEAAAASPGEAAEPIGAVAGDCPGAEKPLDWLGHENGADGAGTRAADRAGAGGADDRASGGPGPGSVAEHLLPLGKEGAAGDAGRVGEPALGPAEDRALGGGESPHREGADARAAAGGGAADGGHPGPAAQAGAGGE
jgi:transposase InsO family protein